MSKLEEKIVAKSEEQIKFINEQAKIDAQKLFDNLIKQGKKELEETKNKQIKKIEIEVHSIKQELERELRDQSAIAKQGLIASVFEEIQKYLESLDGENLFNYCLKAIKNAEVTGNEVMKVSKKDYNKYLKALSTQTGSIVSLDKLNDKLGKDFKLTLSKEPALIENGFILEGEYFDLNFSFDETLEQLAKQYEKKIYEEMN